MTPMTDLPEIPGFQLDRLLGRGAYGHVYLARETDGLTRLVALKVFSVEARRAYEKELEVLKRVEELRRLGRHPGLVQAFASGEHDARGWIALEYLESGSLRDRVEQDGPLPWKQALGFVIEATEAVRVLHEAGLFHRDLKPANLLLGSDGRVRVGDFGLARDLDGSLSTAGSPAFSPPEVIAGQVDPGLRARVDVYGLGATLSFLLTGETARPGRPDAFLLERCGAPRALVDLLLEAMAYEPDERPADAAALLQRLQELTNLRDSGRALSADPEEGGKERAAVKKTVAPTPPVVRTDLEVEVERPRCPFCHQSVSPDDRKQACDECMAWHHTECWQEGGQCSACGRKPEEQEAPRRTSRSSLSRALAAIVGVLVAMFLVSTTMWVGMSRGDALDAESFASADASGPSLVVEASAGPTRGAPGEVQATEVTPQQAQAELTEIRDLTGDVREVFQKAREAHQQHKYEDALNGYDWVLRVHPAMPEVYYLRAHVFLLMDDPHMAQIHYDEAIRLLPTYAEAYYQRANAREAQGDFREAVQDNTRALELLPPDDFRREDIEANLAGCQQKLVAEGE